MVLATRSNLKDFFVVGDGIHPEVIQNNVKKYLGEEATCKPSTYSVLHRLSNTCVFRC